MNSGKLKQEKLFAPPESTLFIWRKISVLSSLLPHLTTLKYLYHTTSIRKTILLYTDVCVCVRALCLFIRCFQRIYIDAKPCLSFSSKCRISATCNQRRPIKLSVDDACTWVSILDLSQIFLASTLRKTRISSK